MIFHQHQRLNRLWRAAFSKSCVLLVICLLLLLSTGCWNRKELNELGIASAIGFDEHNGTIAVSVQILDPGQIAIQEGGSAEGRAPVTVYTASEPTVFESIRAITTNSPRKIYLSHLRTVIISEKLARKGIRPILDFLARDHELRRDFYILIARNAEALQVLNILTPIEKLPANNIYNSLTTTNNNWGTVYAVDLESILSDLLSKGKQPLIPGVFVSGNVQQGSRHANVEHILSSARITVGGMAGFRSDKLVGWLGEEASRGASFIADKMKSTVLRTGCPQSEGVVAYEIIRSNSRKIASASEVGKPVIRLKTDMEANISEVDCKLDLDNPVIVKELEKKLKATVEEDLMRAVNDAQKLLKSDIYGFGSTIYRQKPRLWKKYGPQWEDFFPQMEVIYEVTTHIRRTGAVIQGFMDEWDKEGKNREGES